MADIKPTSIRIDERLYERIKKDAEEQKRSISKQIEYIVEQWYQIKDS